MARNKNKANKNKKYETDGAYVLKLVFYVIIGSLWLKVDHGASGSHIPLPIGLLIGLLFTSQEHFRIDRKIEYAVLVVAALIGLMASYGLYIGI